MEYVDDFQIITTPMVVDDFEIKKDIKDDLKSNKSILNKVSKKSKKNKEIFNLKPKWIDSTEHKESGTYYNCLDIEKVLENENKNKIEKFGALSTEEYLKPGALEFYRCCDGNRDYPTSKFISFSILHPTKKCMVTGSNDGILCVFKIDGEHNNAVDKPFYFDKFPINGGQILPDGKNVIFFSKRSFYKVLDLTTGKIKECRIERSSNIRRLEVSPSGDYIVFSNENTTIFIVCTVTFNVIHMLHMSHTIKSMSFSHNGKYLYVLEEYGKISVFEFNEKGCPVFYRKWFDSAGVKHTRIAISPDNKLIACGSLENVSIYNLSDTWKTEYPKAIKSIQYLGNIINQLAFNHSSELLAIGYCQSDKQTTGGFRLVNMLSLSIYHNFPGSVGTGRPTSFSFSPNGKYFAVGRFNGKVTLFTLNHYKEY